MSTFKDLTGKRFGRLIAVNRNGKSGGNVVWLCKCDCGNYTNVSSSKLATGKTKSCGCLKLENGKNGANYFYIKYKRLYNIWNRMKKRCLDKKENAYKNYGGRGITICKNWELSFENFKNWALENGYKDDLTIDRIDNNKGYFPDNCRWADRTVQANNTRSNRLLTYKGKTMTLSQWAKELNIWKTTIYRRLDKHSDNLDLIFNKGDNRYGKRKQKS